MVAFVIYDIMEFVKYMYMVKVFLRCWVVSYAYKMLIINGFTSIHWQIIKEFYVQLSLHPATVYYHESSICKPPPPPSPPRGHGHFVAALMHIFVITQLMVVSP